ASSMLVTNVPQAAGSSTSVRPVVNSSSPPARNGVGSSSALVCTQLTGAANVAASPYAVTRNAGSAARSARVTGTLRLLARLSPNCPPRSTASATLHTAGPSELRQCDMWHPNQSRRLATEIPGPQSRRLQQRRADTVAAGVASTLPVYVAAAHGGILADVDGNRMIDLGSGIAVTSVGNAAPEVTAAVHEQADSF